VPVPAKKFSECLVLTHCNTGKGIKKRISLVKVMLINYSYFIKLTINLQDHPAMKKLNHLLSKNINEIIPRIKIKKNSVLFVKNIYLYCNYLLFFVKNVKNLAYSLSISIFLLFYKWLFQPFTCFSNNNSSYFDYPYGIFFFDP